MNVGGSSTRAPRPVGQPSGVVVFLLALAMAALLVFGSLFALGYTSGLKAASKAMREERSAVLTQMNARMEMLESERTSLRDEAQRLRDEVDGLNDDLELEKAGKEATVTPNAFQKSEGPKLIRVVAPIGAKATARPMPARITTLANKRRLTKSEVKYIVKDAAAKWGVPESRLPLLYDWAMDIVWEGAHESSGNTRLTSNPPYAGMWQFDGGWRATPKMKTLAKREKHKHEDGDWRKCGVCSTRRWVKSMKDYGYDKSAVRRQWPTLGR